MKENIFKQINDISSVDEFWSTLEDIAKERQVSIDTKYRKQNGIFYTHLDVARNMIQEIDAFKLITEKEQLLKCRFLEPCVGIGVFVFTYIDCFLSFIDSPKDFQSFLDHIFVADIDIEALNIYIALLRKYSQLHFDYTPDDAYFSSHIAHGLMYRLDILTSEFITLGQAFPTHDEKFDIVITNPPYRNLKAEKNKYSSNENFELDKKHFQWISSHSKSHFKNMSGVLNIYKLFVEEIILRYTNESAIVSLLIPTTIFNDQSCAGLRKVMFEENCLLSVNAIKENNDYFDASQSLSSILIKKGTSTKEFRVCKNYNPPAKCSYELVDYQKTLKNRSDNSILFLSKNDEKLLNLLLAFPKVADLSFIVNMRGELDLTSNKDSIIDKENDYLLLRGRDIKQYRISSANPVKYVDEIFVNKSPKRKYILSPRIACQQISNLEKEQRLTFAYIPKNHVLGNSCNFICVDSNIFGVDYFYLLALLNSSVMNWFFKINSSNNHINNYDIDQFPIPISPIEEIVKISEFVRHCIEGNGVSQNQQESIDEMIKNLFVRVTSNPEKTQTNLIKRNVQNDVTQTFMDDFYKLTNIRISQKIAKEMLENNVSPDSLLISSNTAYDSITQESIGLLINKYLHISRYKLLNHSGFKLSNLDLEMVQCVPQGGNWKNISQEVAQKSKRLLRINETGGRTTLYGRLDYNKPSYTITTYFNRPGNGTYIHPVHDRVISVREAARFQSFPDDYFFIGNKTELLSQVGNAVPPKLAYAIALQIKKYIPVETSVDLFVGAGGMTLGFKNAGINSIVGVDYDKSACLTLKVNNPEINTIHGDLTLDSTKNKIDFFINNHSIDMVCGGPPCQGFSHAGKRFIDDPRNQLFKEYWEVLRRVHPKVFVMENVEGIRTMQEGLVYKEITESFESLGYLVEGKTLLATDFGVPQKRKRVIIIGVDKDLNISPADLFPIPFSDVIPALDAIGDLENIECSDEASYINPKHSSAFINEMRKRMPKD